MMMLSTGGIARRVRLGAGRDGFFHPIVSAPGRAGAGLMPISQFVKIPPPGTVVLSGSVCQGRHPAGAAPRRKPALRWLADIDPLVCAEYNLTGENGAERDGVGDGRAVLPLMLIGLGHRSVRSPNHQPVQR